MQTADDIKKLAYQDTPPETGSPAELCFWVRMRYIYKAYKAKLISYDVAQQETMGAERDFGVMQLWEKIYDKYTVREQESELAAAQFRKNPTEDNKDNLLRILMPEAFMMK